MFGDKCDFNFVLLKKKVSNVGNLEDDEDTKKRRYEEELIKKLEAKYEEAFAKLQASLARPPPPKEDEEKRHLESLLESTAKKLDQLENALKPAQRQSARVR